jgi:hypothetical protein
MHNVYSEPLEDRTVPRPGPGTRPLSRAVRVTVTVVATGPAVAEGKLLGRPAGGSRGLRCQGGDGRGRDGPVISKVGSAYSAYWK